MKFEFTAALLFASLASEANAFWGTAHLLIARMAQTILEEEAPDALDSALTELAALTKYYPSLTEDEDKHPFTECATFADDIKGEGYSFQADWHFINLPVLLEGGELSDFDFTMPDVDVHQALEVLTAWMMEDGDYMQSTYYQQIADKFSYDSDGRSFALRLIIHYVGDIHQPLHSTAGIDEQYPSGDRGGNSESLPSICGAGNLHAVWDSVLYNYCGFPSLPASDSDWTELTTEADNLQATYNVTDSRIMSGQFNTWASESYDIAVEYVYPGVTAGTALTDAYIEAAAPVIKSQMVYGGRRLAELIKQIYPTTTSSSFLQ